MQKSKTTVTVGCRLTNGLTLHDPSEGIVSDSKAGKYMESRAETAPTVYINGIKDSPIKNATFATTEVDADFWAIWKVSYADWAPFKTGAIFEVGNEDDAKIVAKDFKGVKTGLEPMPQSIKDAKGKEVLVAADKE